MICRYRSIQWSVRTRNILHQIHLEFEPCHNSKPHFFYGRMSAFLRQQPLEEKCHQPLKSHALHWHNTALMPCRGICLCNELSSIVSASQHRTSCQCFLQLLICHLKFRRPLYTSRGDRSCQFRKWACTLLITGMNDWFNRQAPRKTSHQT